MSRPAVLVLGAGPGLGSAVAHHFGHLGYRVGLLARSAPTLERLVAELEAGGIEADAEVADAGDTTSLTDAITTLAGRAGRVDVLHHNVSIFRPSTVDDVTPAQLLADLGVGAASLLTAVQAVLPWMRAAGTGTITVTGGGTADHPATGGLTLGVQKAALRNLTQALARELRPDGIHVATVTVNGTIAAGTPFAPETIAAVLADLVTETSHPTDTWRTVVPHL